MDPNQANQKPALLVFLFLGKEEGKGAIAFLKLEEETDDYVDGQFLHFYPVHLLLKRLGV